MSDDDWGTSTGLPDDYDAVVQEAFFMYNSKFNVLQLHLIVQDDTAPEPYDLVWNCGPDWQTFDGGKTASHPKATKFNTNTQMGKLVNRLMEILGDEVKTVLVSPRNAEGWIGTKWHWGVVQTAWKNDKGEEGISARTFPTEYLGKEAVVLTDDDPLASIDPEGLAIIEEALSSSDSPSAFIKTLMASGHPYTQKQISRLANPSYFNERK